MTTKATTEAAEVTPRIRIPHTYVIILSIVLLTGIATYLVPSGVFERAEVSGRKVVIPGTFNYVDKAYLSPFKFVTAIPAGMADAAPIIFYIFMLGGAFAAIRATGAIDAGIQALVRRLGAAEHALIPVVMFVFSVLGFTTGMSEESIIFVPIGIAVALALGYDAIVGTAMVALGAASGFIGGMMNPFTVGVAQSIAELPLFSGMLFRAIVYVFVLSAGIFFVMRYARRVKADPSRSLLHGRPGGVDRTDLAEDGTVEVLAFTLRRKAVVALLVIGLGVNMYGVFNWDWFLVELPASFFLIALVCGLVGGLNLNQCLTEFVEGMRSVAFGALIVGFARAILVILRDGEILDTMVNAIAQAIQNAPTGFAVILMFIFQVLLNFLIPSGSGQAATTMPIMVPLSDLLGVDRQLAVLAFQYGDGITNSIIPTSASLMGYLAVARIPYEKWVRFVWPIVATWIVIAAIALIIGSVVGVG